MALDHMSARPSAILSEPQATNGTRTAHTATRPSAIPAAVTYARIGPLRLTRPRMTRARGWCCDLGYSPAEFSLSSSQPEDATARCIPTFPELTQKEAPGVPGLEWEEKDSAKTKKAGNGAGLSASRPKTGLAVGARVTGWREQPSAAARLGAIDTISVRRLPVLGLLGLLRLAVLRIRWSVRHISLG